MNKITRDTAKEMGVDFNSLINDMDEISYEEHRRGSNFFTRSIVVINEEYFPEIPRELDGFWETNTYISDSDYGHESSDIYELDRVEKKEKVVTTIYWEKVK
jgi:hypothetical protein